MRVAVTGATGLIGRQVIATLRERGDEVTVLSRDPGRARKRLDSSTEPSGANNGSGGSLDAERWEPTDEPAPTAALAERDAIVHLAGENIAQRWSASAKRAIRESRVTGTRHLVQGLAALPEGERPKVLLSGSAIGYYGAHGDEPIDEDAPAGSDFLA